MDLNQQRVEIEQFLLDVRQHIRASLETSEYENTSNMFHVTEAQSSIQLLQKCEQLLEKFMDKNHNNNASRTCNGKAINGNDDRRYNNQRSIAETTTKHDIMTLTNGNDAGSTNGHHEDASYLDMTANKKTISLSREYMAFNNSTDSDKTFRCSTRNAEKRTDDDDAAIKMVAQEDNDNDDDLDFESNDITFDEEPQIYDICHVQQADPDETQKAMTPELDQTQLMDCPYIELPAGHLSIQRSTKYGPLQRIEKRFFFDQNKKCFCGILNDWLLCYADGPTASRPNITLHLKSHGIEIEHWGEGKRRDVCFQITTADPNKKFVFQANNEVDAKEWIHAIEAAIRGDCASILKNARKLPTPPVMKRMTFISQAGQGDVSSPADCIYEEPSPLYHVHEPTELLISNSFSCKESAELKPPELPNKLSNSQAMAKKYEYDVPKCPPQPLKLNEVQSELEMTILLNNVEPTPTTTSSQPATQIECTNSSPSQLRPTSMISEKVDFQSKVKDVHSKLSSQLSAGPSLQKKPVKKTLSSSSNEAETLNLTTNTPTTPTTKELKKQKKSNTPSPSAPKVATIGKPNGSSSNASAEKSAKNWFLNRLNKTTSSTRSSNCSIPSPAKCKQSEKENLLSNLEIGDSYEGTDSNPASPILKSSGSSSLSGAKSKVNMIINQFETSGHLAMFSVETLAGNAVATFNSFCDSDCNNYEPIMTISTPPSSFMKKV